MNHVFVCTNFNFVEGTQSSCGWREAAQEPPLVLVFFTPFKAFADFYHVSKVLFLNYTPALPRSSCLARRKEHRACVTELSVKEAWGGDISLCFFLMGIHGPLATTLQRSCPPSLPWACFLCTGSHSQVSKWKTNSFSSGSPAQQA